MAGPTKSSPETRCQQLPDKCWEIRDNGANYGRPTSMRCPIPTCCVRAKSSRFLRLRLPRPLLRQVLGPEGLGPEVPRPEVPRPEGLGVLRPPPPPLLLLRQMPQHRQRLPLWPRQSPVMGPCRCTPMTRLLSQLLLPRRHLPHRQRLRPTRSRGETPWWPLLVRYLAIRTCGRGSGRPIAQLSQVLMTFNLAWCFRFRGMAPRFRLAHRHP